METNKDTVTQWRESAPYWEKHRQVIRKMFAPVTEVLIADAGIVPGYNVLDVGTGPGEPALSVAEFVGREGSVCGIDPAPEMIAAAQRGAEREGFSNIRFEVGPADKLSFAPATFDAIVSRFAVMFFPSPLDGVREILRVLKPERRVAFAVWSFADNNPFHCVVSRIMERYVASPPLPPDAPDAFRHAPPGKLRAILDEAGAKDIRERQLQFRIEAALPAEDFWNLRREMSEKLRSKLAALSGEVRENIGREVIDAFRDYSTGKGMSFPAEVLIVSGMKR